MVLDFETGAKDGKVANVAKVTVVVQNIVTNECDPEHPDEPKVKNWRSDESQQTIQQLDAIESDVLCKKRSTCPASGWGLHSVCALVMTDGWDMNDEKHATAMKHLRETIKKTKLIVTCPRGCDISTIKNWLRTSCDIH